VDEKPDIPDEVLPQESDPVRTAVRTVAPTRALRPGDRICGECGEGNAPTRKFCSRCGESLAAATTVRPPWWRRLRRRGPRSVKATDRPRNDKKGKNGKSGRRPVGTFVRRYAFVVVLLFGLATSVYPPLRTFVTTKAGEARAGIARVIGGATLNPVRPTSVAKTTTESPGHPASAAFDQFKNTYWAAPWGNDAPQPTVSVDLGKPTALGKVIVTSGAAGDFAGHSRPSILLFAYSNEKSDTVTLRDTPEPQEISLGSGFAATTVRVQVVQVFETAGADDVALTELEFFGAG
jgi:hypothetical protein